MQHIGVRRSQVPAHGSQAIVKVLGFEVDRYVGVEAQGLHLGPVLEAIGPQEACGGSVSFEWRGWRDGRATLLEDLGHREDSPIDGTDPVGLCGVLGLEGLIRVSKVSSAQ